MKNVVFNEDCNHLVFTRQAGGLPHLTREEIFAFAEQYKNTGIHTMMFDIGAPLPWVSTKTLRSILETYPDFIARGGKRVAYVDYLLDFYQREGTDVQTVMFEAARKAGLSPHISFRMSDVHEGYFEDSFLRSDFQREHRFTYCIAPHRAPAAYSEYSLNYHFEEVRAHFLSIITEALDTFDADGLELDFLREAWLFGVGKEHEGIPLMNEFVRDVRAALDRAEKKWGHKLTLSVRMPDSPLKALRFGFDIFDWVEAGLIDRIAVSSRWATTDTGMPVDLWKRMLKGKDVTLAAGIEILMRGNPAQNPVFGHSYETAVGTATAFLSQGADEIYLFNFFDFYNGVSNIPYFGSDKALYQKFLSIAGDYAALIDEPRRHVLSYNDMPTSGCVPTAPLPIKLSADRNAPTPFHSNIPHHRMRIVTGKIPEEREVLIVLGLKKDTNYRVEDLTVYLNQAPCAFFEMIAPERPAPDGLDYLVFRAVNDGKLPDASVIELGFAHGESELLWAEIKIL